MALFPDKDADFNDYFGIVYAYLIEPANLARFLISATNLANLNAFKTQWDILYPQSQSTNTATKTIIDNKNILRGDIEELLRDIYGDIPESVLTTGDRNTLNLKERTPGSPRPAITTKPNVILNSQSGFRILVENRVVADSTRASKHEDCDVVEYKYKVMEVASGTTPGTPGSPTPGPAAVWVGPLLSGKARFAIQLADTEGGKLLTITTRWKNTLDDSKSGPWSDEVSARVNW
jgi:hypothetical protein